MSLHGRTKHSTEELISQLSYKASTRELAHDIGSGSYFAVSTLPDMLAEAEASGAEGQGELWSMGPCVNDNWRHTHISYP